MKQKYMEKWERTKSRGRGRFVWIHGVIGFGIPLFICLLILGKLVTPQGSPWINFLNALLIASITGYLWGAWFWNSMEKDYERTKKKSKRAGGF